MCSIHSCPVHCQNVNFVRNKEEIIVLNFLVKVDLILWINVIELLQLVATFPISSFFHTFICKVISGFFHHMSLVTEFYLTVNSCGSYCIFILSCHHRCTDMCPVWLSAPHRTHAFVHILCDMQIQQNMFF